MTKLRVSNFSQVRASPPQTPSTQHRGRGLYLSIWEYPYGCPAMEACCPHKVQSGEYFAGPWQSSARLSACALTAK
eukprot:scaffold24716_cov129-Isochrysis_galbana.AAC.1